MLAGIVAGGAFLISFILGLFGRAPLLTVFLRALAFSGCFFGIVAGIYFLYNKFLLPVETDEEKPDDTGRTGHNIDYTLSDDDSWLSSFYGGENGAHEDISKIIDGGAEDIQDVRNRAEAVGANAFAENPKTGASEDLPGVLEQSNDNGYSVDRDSPPPNDEAGVSAGDGYGMNMSVLVPGIPGIEDGGYSQAAATQGLPDSVINEGTVDMSVDRRAGKPDLGFSVDGKKMAGAIQTLLKKDLG
jgi:hypothetical protein